MDFEKWSSSHHGFTRRKSNSSDDSRMTAFRNRSWHKSGYTETIVIFVDGRFDGAEWRGARSTSRFVVFGISVPSVPSPSPPRCASPLHVPSVLLLLLFFSSSSFFSLLFLWNAYQRQQRNREETTTARHQQRESRRERSSFWLTMSTVGHNLQVDPDLFSLSLSLFHSRIETRNWNWIVNNPFQLESFFIFLSVNGAI